jgi:hypothetical protein
MLLVLSLQATVETDLLTWVLTLFLTMFLLCVCVGIVGTYVQRKRDREWQHVKSDKQEVE